MQTDEEKSGFQSIDVRDAMTMAWEGHGEPPEVFKHEPPEFEVFALQDDPQPEVRDALTMAAGMLADGIAKMHADLVDGMGKKLQREQQAAPPEAPKDLED